MGDVARCANPSHASSRSSVKLYRSTGEASSGLKSSAVLNILCKNIWDLLNMSSKGHDNLRAIQGRDGARTSMNWTNRGNSARAAPTCKDEGGWVGGGSGGVWGGGGRGRKEPSCLHAEEEKQEKGEDEELGLALAPLEFCRNASGLLDRALARPRIANSTSFRRWSRPKRSLRGAGPKYTALGCGGESRGDSLHSHLRASLPPPPLQDHWGRPEPELCVCVACPGL